MDQTTLTADVLERASGVPGRLAQMPTIRLLTASLPSGDYAVGDALGIERKTSPDLAQSIIDGRLFRQIGSLRRNYRRPLLLVEGLTDGATVRGVAWPQLRGALVSVSVCFGVPVLRSADVLESVALIATAAIQLSGPIDIPYVRPGYRPSGWRRRALYILQGLPGIGSRRAHTLLDRFGSVAAIARADAGTLASVPGIGDVLARLIREALGEETRPAPEIPIRSPSPTVPGTDS